MFCKLLDEKFHNYIPSDDDCMEWYEKNNHLNNKNQFQSRKVQNFLLIQVEATILTLCVYIDNCRQNEKSLSIYEIEYFNSPGKSISCHVRPDFDFLFCLQSSLGLHTDYAWLLWSISVCKIYLVISLVSSLTGRKSLSLLCFIPDTATLIASLSSF